MNYYIWGSAASLVIGGLIYCFGLYYPNEEILRKKKTHEVILSLFSHIDNSNTGPMLHVAAGVLTVVGLTGLLTLLFFRIRGHQFNLALALGIFSALTVIFFSVMEIWTLWQTRRIAFSRGYVLSDFRALILKLTEELRELDRTIREDHDFKTKEFHRLYIVAPHFFFGMLSFPEATITRDYRDALIRICRLARETNHTLKIDILCSDEVGINSWHVGYYESRSHADKPAAIDSANIMFEEMISEMDRHAEEESSFFMRMDTVPKVQFMIIGSTLFEFTMNSKNNYTEIYDTQVVTDSRTTQAYIEQFEFIKDLALRSKPNTVKINGATMTGEAPPPLTEPNA